MLNWQISKVRYGVQVMCTPRHSGAVDENHRLIRALRAAEATND